MLLFLFSLTLVCVVGMAVARPPRSPHGSALSIFDALFPGPSWGTWRACLTALLGLPIPEERQPFVRQCTGGRSFLSRMASEILLVCGRQSGKTTFVGFLGVYLSTFKKYPLRRGERLTGMLIATDRRQVRNVKDSISALLHSVPSLAALIDKETADSIVLLNGITIEIHTASYRSVRGYRCAFVIVDEGAFLPTDGPGSDAELMTALRPTLATTGGPLIVISTPYARAGIVYETHSKYYGSDSPDVWVWAADSLTMNSTISPAIVARHFETDPEVAASEWGRDGQIFFRSDLQNLFLRDALGACVVPGRPLELPPQEGIEYFAFTDTASGSDESYTLALAHKDGRGRVVLDVCRERPSPFDPYVVTGEYCALLRRYRCIGVLGDRYAPGWVSGAFEREGIRYDVCELNKSQLAIEMLALVNSRQCELPDHARLLAQYTNLQRRVGPSGRDVVDHPAGRRDDLANAVSGAAWLAATRGSSLLTLPPDFVTCNRMASGLPSDGRICYLFAGASGWRPPEDAACSACLGHQAVKRAYGAHVKAGGDRMPLPLFRGRFMSENPYTHRAKANAARRQIEDALGV